MALIAVGLTAASLSFVGHHVLSFDGHAWSTVFLVILGSAAAAAGMWVVAGGAAPSTVVVARPSVVTTRPLHASDLRWVARLHAEALPHGFLVTLGHPFLRSYDRTFADSPHAVALVAEIDGHPIGFLLGVLRPTAHRRFVRRRRAGRLAVLGTLGLLARPGTGVQFARTRLGRYLRAWRSGGAPPEPGGHEPAVLSHIAVEPGARGAGAGALLVRRFADAARAAGAADARLLTVVDDAGASAFYRQLGWRIVGTRSATSGTPARHELALEFGSSQ